MKKLFSYFLDFIFPPSCPICECCVVEHGTICPDCWAKFNWISDPKCAVCGYPFPADLDLGPRPLCPNCAAGHNELDYLRSACVYDDVSRGIMLPFKHAGKIKYVEVMSRAMINALAELYPDDIDAVMPVPLSRLRLIKRGYNQAAILARPIAKHFGVPMLTRTVWRKYRPDMGHKTAAERRANIKGTLQVKYKEDVQGKKILLVDDVMTSGATFKELRRVLIKAGAKSVYGITFCRVVRAI